MSEIISRQMIADRARAAFLQGKLECPYPISSAAHKTWTDEIKHLSRLRNAMTHQPDWAAA